MACPLVYDAANTGFDILLSSLAPATSWTVLKLHSQAFMAGKLILRMSEKNRELAPASDGVLQRDQHCVLTYTNELSICVLLHETCLSIRMET